VAQVAEAAKAQLPGRGTTLVPALELLIFHVCDLPGGALPGGRRCAGRC